MAVLSTQFPTLLDLANRLDPDGQIADIAEILVQTNEILEDIPWVECNSGMSHQTVVRTGIPTPTWRKAYGGVQPTKSTTAKIQDAVGDLQNYGEVDKLIADVNGNTTAFRFSEEVPVIQGFANELASNVFYGNEAVNVERFTGLAPRFNSKSASVQTSVQLIDGGGSGNTNTSIWLIGWGNLTCHGLYMQGSKAGLEMKDLGEVTLESAPNGGGRMQIYRTHYKWNAGFCVRDWRYIVRAPNIDVTQLTKDASAGADLIDIMTQMLELINNLNDCTPVFYINRRVRGFLRRQMVSKIKQSTLTWEMEMGKPVVRIDGVPVKRCDSILNTEATVS